MDWSEPASAVMSHGTAAALRVLAGADGPFSIRELARLGGISPTRARQAIARLAEHGLVMMDATAGAKLVRLNRDHVATEPAVGLATLRARVIDRLRTEVAAWDHPAVHVSVFGSAARGNGGTGSDIDLLVIHDELASVADQQEWDDQLAGTGDIIHRWTGNWVGWFQITTENLRSMATANEPIVAEWEREAITILGPHLPLLLRSNS